MGKQRYGFAVDNFCIARSKVLHKRCTVERREAEMKCPEASIKQRVGMGGRNHNLWSLKHDMAMQATIISGRRGLADSVKNVRSIWPRSL